MKVGFIGLGNMGSGMVKNLLTKDYDLIGFDVDINKSKELEAYGLQKATSVADISKSCDVVILCLPNPDTSHKVIEELLAENNSISTIIETSTLTPKAVREFEDKIKSEGKDFLSAPMIGGRNHASERTIEFLIEGLTNVFEENRSVFEAMGTPRFMGDVPSATLAKLTFNLSRYANLAVGVEAYRMLEKYNANIPAIYDFMSEQSLDNFGQVWKEDLKEMMTSGVSFKPSQVPKKDLALLIEMASNQDLNQDLIEAVRKTYISMEQV